MQIEIMRIAMRLKPGEAICIPRGSMVKAAEGNLTSLLFDSVRDSDIREFAEVAGPNWDVVFIEDLRTGGWTMHKK